MDHSDWDLTLLYWIPNDPSQVGFVNGIIKKEIGDGLPNPSTTDQILASRFQHQ